jgi:hypothetical protein
MVSRTKGAKAAGAALAVLLLTGCPGDDDAADEPPDTVVDDTVVDDIAVSPRDISTVAWQVAPGDAEASFGVPLGVVYDRAAQRVQAVDPATGDELATFGDDEPVVAAGAGSGHLVYLTREADGLEAVVVDLESLEEETRAVLPAGDDVRVTVVTETVLVATLPGSLTGFHVLTGDVLFEVDDVADVDLRQARGDDGSMVVVHGDGTVRGLRAPSGQEVWAHDADTASIEDDAVVVDGVRRDPRTGSDAEPFDVMVLGEDGVHHAAPVEVTDDGLVITGIEGTLPPDLRPRQVLTVRDVAYVLGDDLIVALDGGTGEELSRSGEAPGDARPERLLAVAGGHLLVDFGPQGGLVALG